MGLRDELEDQVAEIFGDQWTTAEWKQVPEPEDVQLRNDAIKLSGTVLYADMVDSTKLVDSKKRHFAAEVYKAFLHCAAKVIRSEGGAITAYDGDRIMAVYTGSAPNTAAVRSALKINYARLEIINPLLKKQYPKETYEVRHTVGVDRGDLWVARTGIRGSNDLVWVGRPANHAAKLSDLGPEFPSWISGEVYDVMLDSVKTTDGKAMWEERTWTSMDNRRIYRSRWKWKIA